MAAIREIKGRIKATANIKRITKTMQMIATAKFQAAQRDSVAAKPYSEKIAALVNELAAAVGDGAGGASGSNGESGPIHPLLRKVAQPKKELVFVITSNRGLCGGYNANILRAASQHLQASDATAGLESELHVVGKKGSGFFKFSGRSVDKFYGELPDTPTYDEVEPIAETMMGRFIAGEIDAVRVVSMNFETMSRQSPQVLSLLPLDDPSSGSGSGAGANDSDGGTGDAAKKIGGGAAYEFSPDAESLLSSLLPITVKTRLNQCFMDANLSENIARMIAMKAATDAADKMRKGLTRQYNRARQAAITTELSEIISGAAALE